MSYIYLQEQGAVSSAECFSDISQFVQSKLNLTAVKSCCSGNEMESCLGFQFGTTCEPSTVNPGGESQMLSVEVSPAKTSAMEAEKPVSKDSGVASGQKCGGSFVKYNRDTHSWKTHQGSLFGDWVEFSETWPNWGFLLGGECWALTMLVPRIRVKESGSLPKMPTITCYDRYGNKSLRKDNNLAQGGLHGVSLVHYLGGIPSPELGQWMMGWPEGWTKLRPLATDKFLSWQQQHGAS